MRIFSRVLPFLFLVNCHAVTILSNTTSPIDKGITYQYWGLDTALSGNYYIVDRIDESTVWKNYLGNTSVTHSAKNENPLNYDGSHNHYQNLMVSILNFLPNTNAVSIWGDSHAIVDKSKAWGAFLSARSGC